MVEYLFRAGTNFTGIVFGSAVLVFIGIYLLSNRISDAAKRRRSLMKTASGGQSVAQQATAAAGKRR